MPMLFICKSLLNGELWEVPWEMVALMGISQASYLVPEVASLAKTVTTARHHRPQRAPPNRTNTPDKIALRSAQ